MLNRLVSPKLFSPTLPQITLGNRVEENSNIHFIPTPEEVCRIDIEFNAGILNQKNKGAYASIKSLLFAGTEKKNEEEILNELDSYGAYYGAEYDYNSFSVTLYSTPELILDVLPLFLEAMFNPIFPQNKLNTFQSKSIAELDQNLDKTSYLAQKLSNKHFFKTALLKEVTSKEQILSISSKMLKDEFASLVDCGFQVYICGNLNNTAELTQLIIPFLNNAASQPHLKPTFEENFQQHYHSHKPGAVQTSVRGLALSSGKNDPNFPHILFANMIFGGYFGSLLMQNIREEKGLTYGIHSSLKSHADYSILGLSTDIKSNEIETVLEEVDREFNHLTTGNFTDEMLEKTRSYTLGVLAKSCDGLFSNLEKTKVINTQALKPNYYTYLFDEIKSAKKIDIVTAAKRMIKSTHICFATCGSEQY